MKKRFAAVAITAVLAAAFVAQGTLVFAASSPSTSTTVSSGSSSSGGGSGHGVYTSTSTTTSTSNGSSMVSTVGGAGGITVVADGQAVGSNSAVVVGSGTVSGGAITMGNTRIEVTPKADLVSKSDVPGRDVIQQINNGTAPAQAANNTALAGYNALTTFNGVLVKDAATGAEKRENTTLTIYVPNYMTSLQNVSVYYIDFVTGNRVLLPVTVTDAANKLISFTIPASGAYCVLYK